MKFMALLVVVCAIGATWFWMAGEPDLRSGFGPTKQFDGNGEGQVELHAVSASTKVPGTGSNDDGPSREAVAPKQVELHFVDERAPESGPMLDLQGSVEILTASENGMQRFEAVLENGTCRLDRALGELINPKLDAVGYVLTAKFTGAHSEMRITPAWIRIDASVVQVMVGLAQYGLIDVFDQETGQHIPVVQVTQSQRGPGLVGVVGEPVGRKHPITRVAPLKFWISTRAVDSG